jgi:hypothetical protein
MAFKDGVPLATCLMEAAAWHKTVKVACKCGHAVYFEPHGLWWLYDQKGWESSFALMRRRYYCVPCFMQTRRRVRPTISAEGKEHPTIKLPLPPEREWKRAQSRFR